MTRKRRVPPDKIQVCLTREDRWRLNQLHKRIGVSRGELFRRGLALLQAQSDSACEAKS
jgi:hypothetical protein